MDDIEPLSPNTPTGWYRDPRGEKQSRYWDGTAWTGPGSDDIKPKPTPTREDVSAYWAAKAAPPDERWRAIVVTTSHELPGRTIVEHRSEVFGITVRSRNMFSDFGASMRNLAGGEVGGYTKMLTDARQESLDRLRQAAFESGADAVISTRMSGNSLTDGITELVAYGAAVRTEARAQTPSNPADETEAI